MDHMDNIERITTEKREDTTNSLKIKINPEYAKLIPELSNTEYMELRQSIEQNGLWHPITINATVSYLTDTTDFKACQELITSTQNRIQEFQQM
jgi:hypothetical protein